MSVGFKHRRHQHRVPLLSAFEEKEKKKKKNLDGLEHDRRAADVLPATIKDRNGLGDRSQRNKPYHPYLCVFCLFVKLAVIFFLALFLLFFSLCVLCCFSLSLSLSVCSLKKKKTVLLWLLDPFSLFSLPSAGRTTTTRRGRTNDRETKQKDEYAERTQWLRGPKTNGSQQGHQRAPSWPSAR